MSSKTKGTIIRWIAIVIDILPPVIATLTQFKVWISKSDEAVVSGLAIIMLALSCIPFMRQIKEFLKSPSNWIMWIVIFLMMVVLDNIVAEMKAVALVGMISNIIGASIYKLGTKIMLKDATIVQIAEQ